MRHRISDRQRLDWLQKHAYIRRELGLWEVYNADRMGGPVCESKNLRTAIDQAIRADRKGKAVWEWEP